MLTPPLRRRSDQQPGDPATLRALVVDDHESYRGYVAALVERFGFEVRECADGAEALRALHDEPAFHLLIIDCEMPRMSGLALISAVRTNAQYSDVYAMMLTAREDMETKISALRMGFDDFLVKSAADAELSAKLSAARRIVARQHKLDEAVRELYGLATRDELTGLFNRRFFFTEAEKMLDEGTSVNLVFFDLDQFKGVNDTFGHLAGDRILRDIGSLFLRRTRHEDLIARYGGDEFVMLAGNLNPDEVEVLALRIAAEIEALQWTFGTETIHVGVTTGLACSTLLDHPTVAQLLSAGDRDLYKNKWLRQHPDEDPALYEYDHTRSAHVVELPPPQEGKERQKN
jgi:diguanylate cyclase (GGDEF)-like protein